ncbi:hypothetical protein Golax_004244 [Gossypium laxum]|uniref:Reverse transcriptase zinc-binding domain-containing protein n=1 Tax=Gossypium laxum TaxID=34288 RepID=A0A7J9AIB3_9ROSI|nr:hypothetical protein [Gossypium laxum]
MWKEARGILILLMAYWLQLMRVVYSVPISLQQGLDQLVRREEKGINILIACTQCGSPKTLDHVLLSCLKAPYSTISYWRKSKLGLYKCNVDVACFKVEKATTYATVIRDWSGKVVNSVSSHRGILLTPSLVEIYVFKEVLSWMHGLRGKLIKRFIV